MVDLEEAKPACPSSTRRVNWHAPLFEAHEPLSPLARSRPASSTSEAFYTLKCSAECVREHSGVLETTREGSSEGQDRFHVDPARSERWQLGRVALLGRPSLSCTAPNRA
jgi:hypothetical protein